MSSNRYREYIFINLSLKNILERKFRFIYFSFMKHNQFQSDGNTLCVDIESIAKAQHIRISNVTNAEVGELLHY